MINLNKNQTECVEYNKNKALLIEAGPGAGKTRVIIERIKYLIYSKKINPESLLVITFSNKAAEELKNRLNDLPNDIINKMQISTIHAFCFKLLNEYSHSDINILDDDRAEKNNLFLRKNLKDLGFKYESYFPQRDIDVLINKYDEYTTFKLKDGFIDYLIENEEVDQEFLNFIKEYKGESFEKYGYFKFPKDEIKDNEIYKNSYLNSRHHQIVKSYPKYLKLLEENNLIDFSLLQVKALDFLKNNDLDLKYKNILIDEFQDTDPIQIEIFKILEKTSDTFTCVGDEDQSIYGFRGSKTDFFNSFKEIFNGEVLELNTNYRSIKSIVEFTENFISHDRKTSKKLKSSRNIENEIYKFTSSDKKEEALKIASLIKHLKDSNEITNYSDVGLLFRSIGSMGKSKLEDLTNTLKENNIPYFIKGNPDFLEQIEIKIFLFLLHYLIENNENPQITSSWEIEWLNLNFFKENNILSKESQDIFSNLEEDYRNTVLNKEREVYKAISGKTSRIKKFHGVFKRDEETLEEIFKNIEKPYLSYYTLEDLKSLGITNQNDLEFLSNLYDLKEKVKYQLMNEDMCTEEDKLTLLDIFYNLIKICPYLNEYFEDTTKNNNQVFNLAQLTNTLYNYEEIIGDELKNLPGLYYFLYQNISKYSSALKDEDAVQIMTIHKSKGLEFKVLCLCSLEKDKFPSKFKETRKGPKPNFKTPQEFLEYEKEITEEKHISEERRVLYVGMTRAEDLLILSTIKEEPEIKGIEFENLKELDNFKDLNNIEKNEKLKELKPIELSYTSLKNYDNCPFKYNLIHNFKFKFSDTEQIIHGKGVHSIIEKINNEIITKKEVNISEILNYDKEIPKDQKDNITYYFENYGSSLNVMYSELPFSLRYDDFTLTGQIDLVYKTANNKLGLMDYKNTDKINTEDISKQLYTYSIAILNNPEFSDYEIDELSVYLIKARKLVKIDFDIEKIRNFEKEINKIVNLIKNEKYPKKFSRNCEFCELSTICT